MYCYLMQYDTLHFTLSILPHYTASHCTPLPSAPLFSPPLPSTTSFHHLCEHEISRPQGLGIFQCRRHLLHLALQVADSALPCDYVSDDLFVMLVAFKHLCVGEERREERKEEREEEREEERGKRREEERGEKRKEIDDGVLRG